MAVGGQAIYWSSSTYMDGKNLAWVISFANGSLGTDFKQAQEGFANHVVWPVRGGN